ncbi:hypothetical protein BFJ66_g17997 [Fusarium oxysporum f. sp. cepae]|uniref:Uncharacterized protein n=1 Tax=Fusarium oxysporum f. sp. cepae TaxID=396571 RepID=A0A3L6N0G6_FUSOX|nr:hypothetical protein BFJ65_g14822 [Fusarium oxysporum f. sp. cepae]RKK17149.1 hypothetical protein BFJ67_g17821 [Fusarium oxysporum f. sp. cepae]RKK17201.1 hypothetical protein BFJ66_g17997 [Fusarium oxysporum f. sp. cepae]
MDIEAPHYVAVRPEALHAQEELPALVDQLRRGPLALRSRRVEVVISCLAISNAEARWTLGLLGSRIFRAFTCINTTHWGIKVGDSYYDLKRGRGLFGKPYFEPAPTIQERDEREVVQSITIGSTHFSDEDLAVIGYDLMDHAPFYHAWFDNCQAFAVNDFAMAVLCLNCDGDSLPFQGFYTPTCQALADIKDLRRLEYLLMWTSLGIGISTLMVQFDYYTLETMSYLLQLLFIVLATGIMWYMLRCYTKDSRRYDERLFRQGLLDNTNMVGRRRKKVICVPLFWVGLVMLGLGKLGIPVPGLPSDQSNQIKT